MDDDQRVRVIDRVIESRVCDWFLEIQQDFLEAENAPYRWALSSPSFFFFLVGALDLFLSSQNFHVFSTEIGVTKQPRYRTGHLNDNCCDKLSDKSASMI